MRKHSQGCVILWAKCPGSEPQRWETCQWAIVLGQGGHLKGSGCSTAAFTLCMRVKSLPSLTSWFKVYFEDMPPKPIFPLGSVMFYAVFILVVAFILNFQLPFATLDTLHPTASHRDQNDGCPKQLWLDPGGSFSPHLLRCFKTQHRAPDSVAPRKGHYSQLARFV